MFSRGTLQQRVIALVLLVIIVTLFLVGLATSRIVYDAMKNSLGQHALEIARFVVQIPEVQSGMLAANPSEVLQPLANQLLRQTSAGFIVFLNMEGIRYSHPNPTLIGRHFTGGDEGPALQGQSYISEAVGVSGPSIRGFMPIYAPGGEQIGVAAVGMFSDDIDAAVRETQMAILRALLLGLAIGIPAAVLLARTVKKTMYGMEPRDIATLLKQREAMLNCLKEGVIFTDQNDHIALINESARAMLGVKGNVLGRNVAEVIPSSRMPQVRASGVSEYDQQQRINNVVILTNRRPVMVDNEVVGVVATFRDKSEVQALAEELTGVKRYVDALRAKTHEFMNKLQAISGLLELEEYQEAREFILQTTKNQQDLLQFLTKRVKDPATVGLLLGKSRQADEMAINFELNRESSLKGLPKHFPSDAMVLVLGNFLENAFESVTTHCKPWEGWVRATILDEPNRLVIKVEDNGGGISAEITGEILEKGFSTKGNERGYGLYLVRRQVEELSGGTVSVRGEHGKGAVFEALVPKNLPQRSETGV